MFVNIPAVGILDIQELKSAIKDSTILVSVMMANNEIGVIQPMEEIGEVCRAKNVFFHTDAAQAFGKIPIDVDSMGVSLMSISSHKIYGPMGVGALYVRRKNPRVRIKPIISGGGQERGMRSGIFLVRFSSLLPKIFLIMVLQMVSSAHFQML